MCACTNKAYDQLQNNVEVIRDDSIARPLREEGNTDNGSHTPSVSRCGEEGLVGRALSSFLLHSDSLLHLCHLKVDERVVKVTSTVVLGDDSGSLLLPSVVDEPSWRLGNQEDEEELEDRGKTLKDRGDSPGPGVGDAEGTVGRPGGNDGTEVPGRVVERGNGSTVGWESQLGDENGCGQAGESESESDQESVGHKN